MNIVLGKHAGHILFGVYKNLPCPDLYGLIVDVLPLIGPPTEYEMYECVSEERACQSDS